MSFMDFIRETGDVQVNRSEPPSMGDGRLSKNRSIDKVLQQMHVKVFVADTQDQSHLEFIEDLFTRSLRCGGVLEKPGDVAIFTELPNFNKEGKCTIVIKYGEFVKPDVKNEQHAKTENQENLNA